MEGNMLLKLIGHGVALTVALPQLPWGFANGVVSGINRAISEGVPEALIFDPPAFALAAYLEGLNLSLAAFVGGGYAQKARERMSGTPTADDYDFDPLDQPSYATPGEQVWPPPPGPPPVH